MRDTQSHDRLDRKPRQPLTVVENLARARFNQSGDGAQERGLTGTVGTQYGRDRSGMCCEGDVGQRLYGAIGHREAVDLKHPCQPQSSGAPGLSTWSTSAPRYAVVTSGLARISSGVPVAITCPK